MVLEIPVHCWASVSLAEKQGGTTKDLTGAFQMKIGMASVPWGELQPSLSLPVSPSGSHGQKQPHGLEIYEVRFPNQESVIS